MTAESTPSALRISGNIVPNLVPAIILRPLYVLNPQRCMLQAPHDLRERQQKQCLNQVKAYTLK